MSTGGKLIIALIALLMIIGWFYMNKEETSQNTDPQEIGDVGDNNVEDDNNVSNDADAQLDIDKIAEKGTISFLPTDPVLGLRAVGNPNAPIKIQEFFSLTCIHCAHFNADTYQQLKTKYIDTGKVYYIFQELPLNGPALYGSMIARCMPEDRYEAFIDLLLRNQDVWAFSGDFKASLKQNAKLAGMSDEDFDTCFNNKVLQKSIATNISKASEVYKISSTPSFIFNNGTRIMHGAKPLEDFETVIEYLMNNNPDKSMPLKEAPREKIETPAEAKAVTE